MFAIFAPLIALGVYYSNDYVWLHGITSRITIWSLNLITGLNNYTEYDPKHYWGPAWYIYIENSTRTGYLSSIQFTTFCTGIQAIAIFMGVILAVPHSLDKNTSKDIWLRKILATFACSLLFYVVNIMRMWLQLYLYHIGYAWDDIHYSISAASSFIAIVAILLLHKIVPEFIMSIIWAMDQIRIKIKAAKGWEQPLTTKPDINKEELSKSENFQTDSDQPKSDTSKTPLPPESELK
jgi:exosortase/archaeosortase family protein